MPGDNCSVLGGKHTHMPIFFLVRTLPNLLDNQYCLIIINIYVLNFVWITWLLVWERGHSCVHAYPTLILTLTLKLSLNIFRISIIIRCILVWQLFVYVVLKFCLVWTTSSQSSFLSQLLKINVGNKLKIINFIILFQLFYYLYFQGSLLLTWWITWWTVMT